MEKLTGVIHAAENKGVMNWRRTREEVSVREGLTAPVPKKDSVQLSEEWKERAVLSRSAFELLDELRKQYADITITAGVSGNLDLREMAVERGSGTYLVITQGFLDRMTESAESFADYRDVLLEALYQLDQGQPFYQASGAYLEEKQVSFWHVPKKDGQYSELEKLGDQLKRFQEQNQKASSLDNRKVRYSVSPEDYNTAGKFARLASASTRQHVMTVMSDAYRSIANLRVAGYLGDKEEQQKARAAIRSLQKLLMRGRRKMSRLQEEELLRARKKRAHAQQELEKEQKIKAEIRKKQQMRHQADGAICKEGELDAYWNIWKQRKWEESQEQYEAVSVGKISAGLPEAGAADLAGFGAEEVVVSAPIAID